MFGISGTELFIIGLFAFIVFGPDKLPEIIRTVNSVIQTFKRTQEDMERTIKAEMYGLDPEKLTSVFNPPASSTEPSTPPKTSTASSLYGMVDDEEEDEE